MSFLKKMTKEFEELKANFLKDDDKKAEKKEKKEEKKEKHEGNCVNRQSPVTLEVTVPHLCRSRTRIS